MAMIEMSCPRCGAGGRVPREKMNTRLVCKKCLQVFHLTAGGHAVIGEPPPPKEAPRERAPRERIEFDVSAFEDLGKKLGKLKLPDVKTLAIAGLVLLITAGVGWMLSRESLEKRVQKVATAINKGDMETVVNLALPGTEMQAMTWAVDLIKRHADLKISMGGQDPAMDVQVQSNTQGGSAQALLRFSRATQRTAGALPPEELQPNPSPANDKNSIEVVLFWTPDTWGNWRLDAKRTAEASAATASPAAGPQSPFPPGPAPLKAAPPGRAAPAGPRGISPRKPAR
jgi:hypothetical protein